MAGHAELKFVMTECSKTQIRLTGLLLSIINIILGAFLWHETKAKSITCPFSHNIFMNVISAIYHLPALHHSHISADYI